MTEQRTAWGWGLASIDAAGNTLDVWYPELTLGEAPAETSRPNHNFGAIAHDEADARGVRRMPVFTVSKLDEPIEDAADAYLRLHLLSMRLAKPNTLNLDGIFGVLPNVVWTSAGPCAVDGFDDVRVGLRLSRGHLTVFGVGLAGVLGWGRVPLSVREARRRAQDEGLVPSVPPRAAVATEPVVLSARGVAVHYGDLVAVPQRAQLFQRLDGLGRRRHQLWKLPQKTRAIAVDAHVA